MSIGIGGSAESSTLLFPYRLFIRRILKGDVMNDLQLFQDNLLREIAADFAIKTWDDFKRRFLLGEGKSPATYQNYLTTCKQYYEFRGGIHPMQDASPEWIEQFYDSLPPDLSTRSNKMCGLKFMYRKIGDKYPDFSNPFNAMSEPLKLKISRSKKDESEKDALSEKEYNGILAMLRKDRSVKGVQNYAIIRFAVTSGMRAAELVALKWENISELDGQYRATFIGKGEKRRTIELEDGAVKAAIKALRALKRRKPQPADFVFNCLQTGRPSGSTGITKSCIHTRVKQIIAQAKVDGIVRANLHVSTHTLRHSCASMLLKSGQSIIRVQHHLGHSNVSTTMIYCHDDSELAGSFEKIHQAA